MNRDEVLWQRAPCAALRLWHASGAARWQLNAAALEWSLQVGLGEAQWRSAADATLPAGPPEASGRLAVGAFALPYRAVAMGDGWLLWLTPHALAAPTGDSGWRDAAEKLALMQGYDRMGFFERDVSGQRDWWDAHMFRLMGLPAALKPPPFDVAIRLVHPDDRERLAAHHRRAMQQAGRYAIRYRLLRADGSQRDVHALTEVRADGAGRPRTLLGVLIDDTDSAERVRAQQAISRQLERALDLAMISVWRIDLQRRRIHFNDIGYRLSGVEPTADGLDLDAMRTQAHPEDLPRLVQAAEQAIAGSGVVDVEARYQNPDGSYRHLLTRRVAERDAQGCVVALAGVSLDQTAQIVERERAHALARRIQLVADAAGVGIWSIEHPGDEAAERVEWNAQMFRIYGLAQDGSAPPVREWMGERVFAADRRRVAAERRRARQAGRPGFETEFRVVRPDGSLRWVVCRSHREQHDGHDVLHGIHLDVTAQRALDQELRLQQQRLHLAARVVGVGIWERDVPTGMVIWDEQMYRLCGLTPDDPRTPQQIEQQIMSPEAYALRKQRLLLHIHENLPFEFEFEVRWPDGSLHWLASTGSVIKDESGASVRMLGMNWDITQRKRAETALRDVETAERASRAKSEFLARMSHELRTPLNAILGFAQLMEQDDEVPLGGQQAARLVRIRSAGAHLLSLIEDVLDLSAVEAGSLPVSLQPVGWDDVLDEVRQWVAPLAVEHGVSLQVQVADAVVLADRRRLRQVLANLMTNAIKYNHAGGQVQVSVLSVASDGRPGWELSVRDTGRGLSEAQLAHLFEPFNRLGAEREGIEGRGIGLSTTRQLVQLMGGRLLVQSRTEAGSDFRVWLPGAQSRAAPAPPTPAKPPEPAPPRSLRVLYVEDNPVNVLVVQELVSMWSHVALQCAPDGGSGVALALREAPDLVLVDLQLPDFDGYEVLRRLRDADTPAEVVALSANAMPEEVARARAAGFDDYWTKPIDFGQFIAGIERLARRI